MSHFEGTINSVTGEEIINLNREHVFFSWSVWSKVTRIPAVRSEGVYFWEADGKRYLDFSAQLMNVNIGHGYQKGTKAIQKQVNEMVFVCPGIATEPRGCLGQLLGEITLGDLCKTLFTLGGSEARKRNWNYGTHNREPHRVQ